MDICVCECVCLSSTIHEQSLFGFNFIRVDNFGVFVLDVVIFKWSHVLVEFENEWCSIRDPYTLKYFVVDTCECFDKSAASVLMCG